MRNIIYLLLLLLFVQPIYANKLDSLLSLKHEVEDVMLAKLFNDISAAYIDVSDFQHALIEADNALKISVYHKDLDQEINAYNHLGLVYYYQGVYDSSVVYYRKALNLISKSNKKQISSLTQNNLGAIYYSRGDYKTAIVFFQEALDIDKHLGAESQMASTYGNLGLCFSKIKDYVKATELFNSALEIYKNTGDKNDLALTYNNLAYTYLSEKDYDKAYTYFDKVVHLISFKENPHVIATTFMNLSRISYYKKKYTDAVESNLKAIDLAKKSGTQDVEVSAYKQMSEIYEALGEIKKALEYYKIHSEKKNDFFNNEEKNKIEHLTKTFNEEKLKLKKNIREKDLEIKFLSIEKNNIASYILTAIIFLLLIIIALLYRKLKHKNK